MSVLTYFCGYTQMRITGADIERFLNVLSEKHIRFWDIRRVDEVHLHLCVYDRDIAKVEKLALSCFCDVQRQKQTAFLRHWKQLRKRPFLWLGMLLALVMSFYFQSYVLAISIEGNEVLHDEEILRALEQTGIHIGSSAADIDQQLTKHRMLNALPQLSWIGVNRSGCMLNVLVTERSFAETNRPKYVAGNIIAACDATITEQIVSEGMRLCKVGDTVKAGQVLVSGFEDYGLILKGVCAEAEIYGRTWYTGMVLTPSYTYQKCYTGKQWTQISLVVGRKRINLFGNSGISDTSCDKMIEVTQLSVLEYEFPIRWEKVTYREYELKQVAAQEAVLQERLRQAWQEQLRSRMIAGQIEDTSSDFLHSDEIYILRAESTCNEMIARLVPMEPTFEGETYE